MSAGANTRKTDLERYGLCARCGAERLLYDRLCDRCHEGGYEASPFGREIKSEPRGEYWTVVGRNRYSGRITFTLRYKTREEARAAVRELRRDYGGDDRWGNPTGPHYEEGARI